MSLKGFHIVFVVITTLVGLVGALFCLIVLAEKGDPLIKFAGVCCALAAVLMPIYGVLFLRKIKQFHL